MTSDGTGLRTNLADSMPLAPPARNVAIIVKLKTGGGIEHVAAPEEASDTQHEFYIIGAACSVRANSCRAVLRCRWGCV